MPSHFSSPSGNPGHPTSNHTNLRVTHCSIHGARSLRLKSVYAPQTLDPPLHITGHHSRHSTYFSLWTSRRFASLKRICEENLLKHGLRLAISPRKLLKKKATMSMSWFTCTLTYLNTQARKTRHISAFNDMYHKMTHTGRIQQHKLTKVRLRAANPGSATAYQQSPSRHSTYFCLGTSRCLFCLPKMNLGRENTTITARLETCYLSKKLFCKKRYYVHVSI